MASILLYVLKVSIGTFVFYLCYTLFFSKETFYQRNRYYLIISLILSLCFPFLNVLYNSGDITILEPVEKMNYIISSGTLIESIKLENASSVNLNNLFLWLYFVVSALLLLRLFISIVKVFSIIRKGTIQKNTFPKVIVSDLEFPPFSFFPFVVIPRNIFEIGDHSRIILHEYAHVKQGHTFDLLLSEILIAFLWFNPLMWLYKRSILLNHEYLADSFSLRNSEDRKEYQYKLLNLSEDQVKIYLAHNFSSSIKKRIVMINRKPTKIYAALKNVIILPAVACLMVMCSVGTGNLDKINNSGTGNEKFISIGDYRNSELPQTDLFRHKNKDLEINRIKWDTLSGYTITTYQSVQGQIKENRDFIINTDKDFNQASYYWENDSTLLFKLLNSATKLSAKYSLIIYGGDKRTSVTINGPLPF